MMLEKLRCKNDIFFSLLTPVSWDYASNMKSLVNVRQQRKFKYFRISLKVQSLKYFQKINGTVMNLWTIIGSLKIASRKIGNEDPDRIDDP